MILADTSVWVEHLRRGAPDLASALEAGRVLAHPHILGELMLGGLPAEAIGLYERLPQAVLATEAEVHALIVRHRLSGSGIGYIDAHLLAATLLSPDACLHTLDRRLATVATRMNLAA